MVVFIIWHLIYNDPWSVLKVRQACTKGANFQLMLLWIANWDGEEPSPCADDESREIQLTSTIANDRHVYD